MHSQFVHDNAIEIFVNILYYIVFHCIASYYKNSSGDEIANVNFLRRYGTYVLQNTKNENLLRLTN